MTEMLNLRNADEYKYLSQSNCYSISGINDAEQFRIVMVPFSYSMQFFIGLILFILSIFIIEICGLMDMTLACLLPFQEALDIVHISKEDQQSVFAMLAAVLWLGNISFDVIDNENHVETLEDESKCFLAAIFLRLKRKKFYKSF